MRPGRPDTYGCVVTDRSTLAGVPDRVFDPRRLAAVARTGLLDTDAEEAFDRLATLAATLLETPFAFVTVVDDTRSFWKACVGVASPDPADRQNRVEDSFCQYVIGTQEPLIVDDAVADIRTRDNPSIESMGVAAWAGYPVHSPDGEVLGTFCVVDTKVRSWTERDVSVLETLSKAAAGEIALRAALDDAHEASLQALAYGEANAELARTLQDSLLPPSLLRVPGLDVAARHHPASPGTRVIGDFYDVVHAQGDAWGVVVGDVCGHGAPAAALTALARYTVSSLATREALPSAVLAELNTAVLERAARCGEDRFLTAAYATMRPDGAGFSGHLCSAGHPAALLRSPGGVVTPLGRPGMLLGVVDEVALKDDAFSLRPGEALVLYTDGVTEARQGRGQEMFGDERLAQVLAGVADDDPAAVVARAVEDAVLAHTQRAAPDDVAIVVLRPTGG